MQWEPLALIVTIPLVSVGMYVPTVCEYEMFSVCNCTVVEMATQEETAVSVKIHTIGMVVNVFHVTATLMEARILTVTQPLVNVLVRYVSIKDNFCH